jgi:hypothetical protein
VRFSLAIAPQCKVALGGATSLFNDPESETCAFLYEIIRHVACEEIFKPRR